MSILRRSFVWRPLLLVAILGSLGAGLVSSSPEAEARSYCKVWNGTYTCIWIADSPSP